MKISLIKVHSVRIPFTFSIDHNLKKRKYTDSVVVVIQSTCGFTGYGEGTPRDYVTGESSESVMKALQEIINHKPWPEIHGIEDIDKYSTELTETYGMPSLTSAMEIALMDLYGKATGTSISEFFKKGTQQEVQYSAVMPYLPTASMVKWLQVIQKLNLSHVKMKVGHEQDKEHLQLARTILGTAIDIRVDANRSWTLEEASKRIEALAAFNISCVEEPLKVSEIQHLAELSQRIEPALLLDESVCSLSEARQYADTIHADKLLFNLKISKLGGMRQSSLVHQFAASQGISCQLGCHVGETAILSAAGRLFAQTHTLKYLEGSFAPFFMEDDISVMPLNFSALGKAQALEGKGLGIEIADQKLSQYSQALVFTH